MAYADDIVVRDAGSLRETLRRSKPGVTLKIASGDYPGGYYVEGMDNLTIEALDPKNPPHFKGGSNAWHFSRCNDLTLRNLQITGQSGNGLNLDDGGRFDQPVKGITLERLMIGDIGPKGNHDGVKCSGLVNLTIRDCTISGWGGQGLDMVGCHDSLVSGCRFVGKPNFTATAGVQTKGGCSDITIEKCHFIQGGERPMNIGGSTDLRLFRRAQVQIEINIGSGTDPNSFMFEGNQWFAEDHPESSKPRLPNEEKKGVYGLDPRRK